MAEFTAGNMYDINKNLVEQYEKPYKGKALTNLVNKVAVPYFTEKLQNEQYFMLLCHEKRDYTVFNICNGYAIFEDEVSETVDHFKNCLINRGTVYGIDLTEDKIALEIWLKRSEDNEMVCFYLFPYTEGIIEI